MDWETIERMKRDIKDASRLMGQDEARYLVDLYYSIQDYRIQVAGQIRSSGKEPTRVQDWFLDAFRRLESNAKSALNVFASEYTVGLWLQSICGIGPVISAGLLAHLDVSKCKTVGHFWRFAGLDPSVTWEPKTKRPWNADLKCLCWKIGESFIKVQSNDKDVYGKMYVARKAKEIERNEAGEFSETAATVLEAKKFRKSTDAYKHYSDGRLPPAHIHSRARRYAVKLFLSHVHHVMYADYFGENPPVPFAFERCNGDHRHFIEPPNWPCKERGRNLRDLINQPRFMSEPGTASAASKSD